MKRLIILLLLTCLLLSGCGRKGKLLLEPVYLYYPKLEYGYGAADSVIDYESMDGTGHMGDYPALLSEYFYDPVDEALVNPFPSGTKLLSAVVRGTDFRIRLTQEAAALMDANFTLAAACLSMTCFELTDCESVTVISGTKQVTILRDSWLLLDDFIPAGPTKEDIT